MSRTYRRRAHRYEYCWVLRDWKADAPFGAPMLLDLRSEEGRRAIARFHSDAETTMRSPAPRWYRKIHDAQLRTFNDRQLRRWLQDSNYDPVMLAWHRHGANRTWW